MFTLENDQMFLHFKVSSSTTYVRERILNVTMNGCRWKEKREQEKKKKITWKFLSTWNWRMTGGELCIYAVQLRDRSREMEKEERRNIQLLLHHRFFLKNRMNQIFDVSKCAAVKHLFNSHWILFVVVLF